MTPAEIAAELADRAADRREFARSAEDDAFRHRALVALKEARQWEAETLAKIDRDAEDRRALDAEYSRMTGGSR